MFAPLLPQIVELSSKISELDSGVNRYQFEASEHKVSEMSCEYQVSSGNSVHIL